ncbi:MAG: hypothetical protein PF447_12400 [Spirochaetaceae bacterium]|nr:hypothetical protein [Spirochaetaceae bacterium]
MQTYKVASQGHKIRFSYKHQSVIIETGQYNGVSFSYALVINHGDLRSITILV